MRDCLLVVAIFVITCAPLYGFQTGNPSDAARPKTTKPKQQASQPAFPTQPANQTQDQKVTVVSVPEVKVEQIRDSLDKKMLRYTRVLTVVGVAGTPMFGQVIMSCSQSRIRGRAWTLKR